MGELNILDTISRTDVRDVLGSVQAPTPVLHRRGERLVDGRSGARIGRVDTTPRFVELPGDEAFHLVGDVNALLEEEVQEFLSGTRSPPRSDRVLATLLFSDIVGSTERASALGDSRWGELLARHDAASGRQLERFGGRAGNQNAEGRARQMEDLRGPTRAECINEHQPPGDRPP